MQWKGPYVISGCKGESNHCIEIDKKKFHINMLKHYIERKKDEKISKDTENDLGVKRVKVGVGIRETEEKYSVNDDELLEWTRCHEKEDFRDIQFGVNLMEDQQKEMMKILETYEAVFSDVPGKSNLIEHQIILNNEDPVRSKPYPLPCAVREELKGDRVGNNTGIRIALRIFDSNCEEKGQIESYLCQLSQVEQIYTA